MRIREGGLFLLGFVFLIAFSWPAFKPEISIYTNQILEVTQWAIWIVFALDFTFELIRNPSKKAYLKSHAIDVIALFLPFFRPLRLLRLLSVGSFLAQKIAFGKSLTITIRVAITAIFLCYLSAVQITIIERNAPNSNIHSFTDGIWWALTTVTTVGYGDKFPVTTQGRLLAFLLMLVGISLVGVITASVAAWFVKLNDSNSND